jgi:hypothetical protein
MPYLTCPNLTCPNLTCPNLTCPNQTSLNLTCYTWLSPNTCVGHLSPAGVGGGLSGGVKWIPHFQKYFRQFVFRNFGLRHPGAGSTCSKFCNVWPFEEDVSAWAMYAQLTNTCALTLGDLIGVSFRVTGLGELSTIGWLFSLGRFYEKYRSSQIFGLLISAVKSTF